MPGCGDLEKEGAIWEKKLEGVAWSEGSLIHFL